MNKSNKVDWELYSKNREVQHSQGLELLSFWDNDWKDGDIVLDVGCGTGELTYKIAARKNVSTVVGVDVAPNAIKFAMESNFITNKTRYLLTDVIDIQDKYPEYDNFFTKAVSVCVLHWIDDKEKAFRNIYRSLKPGGGFACLFCLGDKRVLSEGITDILLEYPKWKTYLQDYKDSYTPFQGTMVELNELITRCGFTVQESYVKEMNLKFHNKVKHKGFIQPLLGHLDVIPAELHEDFMEDVYQIFLSQAPRDEQNRPYLYYPLCFLKLVK
ncbi:juvenile hormone acid O-methyltransferase-like [Glandiceps talaboti]